MTDLEQRQAFWQMTFSDKVTACEYTFAAWRHAIEKCQEARKKAETHLTKDNLAFGTAEQDKQNREAAYREARKELEAWVRTHPYPVA